MYQNPYYDVGSEDDGFFYNETILRKLKRITNLKRPNNALVVAERGMKANEMVRFVLSTYREKLSFGYIECDVKVDFQQGKTAADFYRALVAHILAQLPENNEHLQSQGRLTIESRAHKISEIQPALFAFFRQLRRASTSPWLIIFYDFDLLIRKFSLRGEDLQPLRMLNSPTNGEVNYLVVSRRPIYLLEKIHDLQTSLFATIFGAALDFQIGLLKPQEAKLLIRAGEKVVGDSIWPSWLEDQILLWGGGHSYCTQHICAQLFDQIWNEHQELEPKDKDQIAYDLKKSLYGYFKRLVTNLEIDNLLDDLAIAVEGNQSPSDQITILKDLGYFLSEPFKQQLYLLFSPFFHDYLIEQGILSGTERRSFHTPVRDDYEWVEDIDITGHSRVYKARDKKLGHFVVIKQLLGDEDNEQNSTLAESLIKEAQILANLQQDINHPNIGRVLFVTSNPVGAVMEWVGGEPLQYYLSEEKRLPVRKIIKIGEKLADALAHVHSVGIIHRDIKPNNVILRPTGEPVLIDFDIARAVEYKTLSEGFVGHAAYCAPEQLLPPYNVSEASDVFALGVVLYELLTLSLPFEHGTLLTLYPNGKMPPPAQHNIPDVLFEIICHALEQEPQLRFQTAKAFRDKLMQCYELIK